MRAIGPLDRKLLRDLRRLWLQAVAVGAVLGCGIALYVMSAGMRDSLERARDAARLSHELHGSVTRSPYAEPAFDSKTEQRIPNGAFP